MGEPVSIEKSTWVQIRDYFSDVRTEMKRVTWPNKQEIYGTTVMVLITTFLFGFYFWVCDQAFMASISRILRHFLHGG
ncbi:MAG: preprotein translocase subunit SecE [Terriglobia bacterium]|jgi:preprotein translocase subunit SecE